MTRRTLSAVVLAAGEGTRMRSSRPKPLHLLCGRAMVLHILDALSQLPLDRAVVVVGHRAEWVTKALTEQAPSSLPIGFVEQYVQRGTGDAVSVALTAFDDEVDDDDILVVPGDTPLLRAETLLELVIDHRRHDAAATMLTAEMVDPAGYGRVVRGRDDRVARVVEHADASPDELAITEINTSIYCFRRSVLAPALRRLHPQNAQGEYYLTDLVEMAAEKGDIAVVNADFIETAGVNDKAELAQVAKVLQERINTRLMKAGVSMVDPATAFIDEDIEIGADSEIGPMVTITQGSKIGRNVVIGQGSVISKSTVADDVQVKPYSVFEEAVVGRGSLIGPFARLRPGSELAEEVHIGNFVETKKTKIAKGSKANHLAYLGDAVIGSGVNVGAGTITCNYDGVNKHQTVLEDGVFIGSDTQLVAPVKVGKGAYVGAGTTVTQDVPEMALAISRAPQTNKEGWVARKKSKEAASKVSVKAG